MIHSLFDYCDRVAGEEKRAFVDLEYEHRLCEALEMCVMGELPNGKKNLIINVPPRCFKTTFTSQGFVSWCLAEVAPDCEFILTSATAGLATENTMAVHRILSSEWHRAQYPETVISRESRELQNFFKTTAGGAVYGVGLGGTITGFGAGKVRKGFGGAIIIDDPLKADDAKSRVRRENCISYYLNTLKSRRNNAHNTPFILIMQRLHVDDLAGWLLKNEPDDWHLISFPALNDNEVLNPITLSKDDLETLKVVAPTTFFAQYQQSPLIPGGISSSFHGGTFMILRSIRPKVLGTSRQTRRTKSMTITTSRLCSAGKERRAGFTSLTPCMAGGTSLSCCSIPSCSTT